MSDPNPNRLLAYRDLRPVYGIAYTLDHLRRKIALGQFPAPVRDECSRRLHWREADIIKWVKGLTTVKFKAPAQRLRGG